MQVIVVRRKHLKDTVKKNHIYLSLTKEQLKRDREISAVIITSLI